MIVDLAFLLGALALVIANGFFVAAEFSLVTVERSEIQRLASAGDRGAKGIQAAIRRLSFQLSGAQLGITITSLLLGVMAEPAIAGLLHPVIEKIPGLPGGATESVAAMLGLLIATVSQMVLGELVPKNAALSRPLTVARLSVPPQRIFSAVFAPLIKASNAVANGIVRALGAEPQDELASARSPDELSLLMSLSAEAGAMPTGTAAMLRRALRFGDMTADEAMTPRMDCVTVTDTDTVTDFLTLARRERHLPAPRRRRRPGRHRRHRVGGRRLRGARVRAPARHAAATIRPAPRRSPSPSTGTAMTALLAAGRSWPSSSTSTAASPASSPSRTWSRRLDRRHRTTSTTCRTEALRGAGARPRRLATSVPGAPARPRGQRAHRLPASRRAIRDPRGAGAQPARPLPDLGDRPGRRRLDPQG